MGLVDDAQREMVNMAVAAGFAAAPQKYFLGADSEVARRLGETPFKAFIGSLFVATTNSQGQTPQFGQLSQMSMQPHIDYMRSLAATFSGATGVPLSSLGVVSDNPSSADAILAAKEDAVVDIEGFIGDCKHALKNIGALTLAAGDNTSFAEALEQKSINVHFASPATPSVVSLSDAIVKQIAAFPWLASSDVPLRKLGYEQEEIYELRRDRRRAQARELMKD